LVSYQVKYPWVAWHEINSSNLREIVLRYYYNLSHHHHHSLKIEGWHDRKIRTKDCQHSSGADSRGELLTTTNHWLLSPQGNPLHSGNSIRNMLFCWVMKERHKWTCLTSGCMTARD
jgi:hypothetical protein